MKRDYRTICCENLLKNLPDRTKEVLVRRFGLEGKRETLEAVGRKFHITRERTRQIEEDGLNKLKEKPAISACGFIFNDYADFLKKNAFLKREDLLIDHFGVGGFQNFVFFMLTLGEPFQRVPESVVFHAFWTTDKNVFEMAKKSVGDFTSLLEKNKQPSVLPSLIPASHIEISKNIVLNHRGLYGLKNWPEINPRGIKDKAYVVLKEKEKPLHFTQVADMINSSPVLNQKKNVIFQTVHNELIKDPRFVLVGRGLYALREWGYEPGIVREVICREINASRKPLEKEEILKRVLNQRDVKPSTILLNLQNKKYFVKTSQGLYTIKRK